MKNICVTGSQGFIGSYICSELLSHNYYVFGIDNYSKYGHVKRPHDNHDNFCLIKDDVININDIEKIKNVHFDCIIAGAAKIGGISYFHKYAYDLLATNERILASTFDFAISAYQKKLLNKILVISSSMVFERTNVYPTPEKEITNTLPPLSTYGFQKLSSEYFCKGAYEQYKLPFIIIRPFNCIGIGEDETKIKEEVIQGNIKMLMSHVVPDLIYKAFVVGKHGRLPILGSGDQIRHYTYGGDIARAIRLSIENPKAINNDFNISSEEPITVNELSKIIWRMIHGNAPLKFNHLEPYHYDIQVRSPNVMKAKEILEFECNAKLQDTLLEIIDSVKSYYKFKN